MTYLDYNATSPVRPEVLDAMLPYLKGEFGNPNSPYALGQRARRAVEAARESVAALLGASDPAEIVFTSCGSESDVLAIAGAAWAAHEASHGKRRRLVTSPIEHEAVRGILALLKRRGFEVVELGVDAHGLVDPAEAERAVTPETALVTVMHANNEVGTLEPVEALAALCRERGAAFHTDAVQSAGKVPIDARRLGLDLVAVSGHKLGAPKGVAALLVRKGLRLVPTVTGHQEKNRRGGTENVAGIVGLGVACALAAKELPGAAARYEPLRRRLVEGALKVPGSRVNGHPTLRLPHCAHFSFDGIDGHHLTVALDLEGICVSSGPACSTGASTPSHVLTAMGLPAGLATGSLRVSMGHGTSEGDLERLLAALPKAVERLRRVPARAAHGGPGP